MGFRFTIDSANIIANLTCGRIFSCYDGIYSSHENYFSFLYFLENFTENMYSHKLGYYDSEVRHAYHILQKKMPHRFAETTEGMERDVEVLRELKHLADIFDGCRIKSLLLPSVSRDNLLSNDEFMTSKRTLKKLLHWHPKDTCLILQPQENPYGKVTVFDAFPHFEVALKQIDKWPAVLFWDSDNNYAFVPVSSEAELIKLYEMVYLERDAILQLRRYANEKVEPCHYFIHLSDLHFGAKNVEVSERRLKSLVKSQLSSLDQNDKIDFVVTGDAVDSPSKSNTIAYRDFSDFLESRSGEPPIFVLGNHDINRTGLAIGRNNQMLVAAIGEYPKIKVIEDIKVIFLLFNSNTSGNLAEGEIGLVQMAEMGNLLDNIPNCSKYRLVAVLHHHVKPIEKPDFYDRKWYEKMLPKEFLEKSLRLLDADLFMEWLKSRNVGIILHGHKHIPFITEEEGINVISCGSSTGQIAHKDPRKTYLSYNVLKFTNHTVVCSQFAEELLGAGVKDIRSVIINY